MAEPGFEKVVANAVKKNVNVPFSILHSLQHMYQNDTEQMKITYEAIQKTSKPISRNFQLDVSIGQPAKANSAIIDWGKTSIMTLMASTHTLY